jgi:uncharacterized protein
LLAYNNGQEVGLEAISTQSQLSKATVKSFIEYLDSAFLISQHNKLPTSGKQIVRKRNFKVFLTNPSMRAALFSPVEDTETETLGHLAEAAILSQWDHISRSRGSYYYRDGQGNEVDLVTLKSGTFFPEYATEIKWSDSAFKNPQESLRGLLYFMNKYGLPRASATSRTLTTSIEVAGKQIYVAPTSWYCLNIGSITSEVAIQSIASRAVREAGSGEQSG